METIFGFIGAGNMGGALARAARRRLAGSQIRIADAMQAKAEELADDLGAQAVDNVTAAQCADFLFLGVKPQMIEDLLTQLRPVLAARGTPFVLVSMAAGVSIGRIRSLAGADYPVIRIMPNTPCGIGEGVILYTCADVPDKARKRFLTAMDGAGLLLELAEGLFDAGGAISGCGPAYVDLFAEALADGGVACGLPRSAAMALAAQTLVGSAKLMLESGRHPGDLKDAVCSPGGSTIQGVRTLENRAFRAAVIEAVIASCEKNKALG